MKILKMTDYERRKLRYEGFYVYGVISKPDWYDIVGDDVPPGWYNGCTVNPPDRMNEHNTNENMSAIARYRKKYNLPDIQECFDIYVIDLTQKMELFAASKKLSRDEIVRYVLPAFEWKVKYFDGVLVSKEDTPESRFKRCWNLDYNEYYLEDKKNAREFNEKYNKLATEFLDFLNENGIAPFRVETYKDLKERLSKKVNLHKEKYGQLRENGFVEVYANWKFGRISTKNATDIIGKRNWDYYVKRYKKEVEFDMNLKFLKEGYFFKK